MTTHESHVSVVPMVTVRQAGRDDVIPIRLLFRSLHEFNTALDGRFALADGWERVLNEHLEREWTHGGSATFLATTGDREIGLAMVGGHTDSPLFQHRQWAELMALYVSPELHGSGVADLLLECGTQWANEHGYHRIQLYVTVTNVRARRFYERSGFHPIQEIWCRGIAALPVEPPVDEVCAPGVESGDQLMTPGAHPVR